MDIEKIILNSEIEKINDEQYTFILCDHPESTNREILLKLLYKYSIIGLSKHDMDKLYKNYYIKYFRLRNVDIEGENIKIGNYIINNFLKEKSNNIQIGDSILPSLYSDLSMIDKGPFEYKAVNLQENDVVIDCGAFIGSFSTIALSKRCIVYAFEPMPKTIEQLQKNLSNYDDNKYHICNCGLSDKQGVADFFVPHVGDMMGNSMVLKYKHGIKMELPVTTIDKYVEENNISRLDFIKADIEGAERYMLLGAADTIRKYSPKLSICTYHLEDDQKVIEDTILSINNNYIIEHKWMKVYAYVPAT